MIINEDEYLAHYGTPRRSGRYPWGSGEGEDAALPRNPAFHDLVREQKKQGLSEVEIARGMGISTGQLRARVTISRAEQKQADISMAQNLRDKGYAHTAGAKRMGIPESTYRSLLDPSAKDKADVLLSVSNALKAEVGDNNFIDVGAGVEAHMGISPEKLNAAVSVLREQGYVTHVVPIPQIGTGKDTRTKVLAPPGTTWGQVASQKERIKQVSEISRYSVDGGRTFDDIKPPLSIHPDRISVRYQGEGGEHADGVMFVRPGVSDVSLGNARYAQVRVLVGKDRYLKGMAMYKDDLPDGVDIVFNTNKKPTGNKLDALKEVEADPKRPFGTVIRRQILDTPGHPDAKPTSVMNLVNEEGDWKGWSQSLSSQFLSKQSPTLIKQQLSKTHDARKQDLDEIMALTNPTVKKKLLDKFADGTDSAAVHLDAAALNSRQRWHAILPVNSLKPTEVYAPNFDNGERVVLVRFPHAGTFEIPELTVNNRHPEAKRLLGDAPDAIGIHHSVAQRLSGADFDGDTVLVIPNKSGKVRHTPALKELENFDPMRYKIPDDSPIPKISKDEKQNQMGRISNLITDMTIRGASHEELARAVKHSMVVIDSEKHGLDWKQSAKDNRIAELREQYQHKETGPAGGASTLISRATAKDYIPERRLRKHSEGEGGPVDPATGRRVYVPSGRTRKDRKGNLTPKLEKVERLALVDNAHDLVSEPTGTLREHLYAEHSNKLKAMANQARLESLKTPNLIYNRSSAKVYAEEASSLKTKLALAKRNAPLERQAQILAGTMTREKKRANPNLTKDQIKKQSYQDLETARARTGAKKNQIEISDKEWDAIQAGAISNNMLSQILDNTDIKQVRVLATPRPVRKMTTSQTNRARAMLDGGATRAEVAKTLGVSVSTLDVAMNPIADA